MKKKKKKKKMMTMMMMMIRLYCNRRSCYAAPTRNRNWTSPPPPPPMRDARKALAIVQATPIHAWQYASAERLQQTIADHLRTATLDAAAASGQGAIVCGCLMLFECANPVVTLGRRALPEDELVASIEELKARGIQVRERERERQRQRREGRWRMCAYRVRIVDYRVRIVDCRVRIVDYRVRIVDYHVRTLVIVRRVCLLCEDCGYRLDCSYHAMIAVIMRRVCLPCEDCGYHLDCGYSCEDCCYRADCGFDARIVLIVWTPAAAPAPQHSDFHSLMFLAIRFCFCAWLAPLPCLPLARSSTLPEEAGRLGTALGSSWRFPS